jgi:alpha-beta hydrolase superfamily lysophospholipase
MSDVLPTIAAAVAGGSGVVGLAFFFLRRWLEGKLAAIERQKAATSAERLKRKQLDDELHHAQGRVLFWVNRFIQTGEKNGDLKDSFDRLTAVEDEIKKLDREIIAKNS